MNERKSHGFFGIAFLLPYIKPYRKKILIMVSLGIVSSLIDSLYPLFNRYILDHNIALKTLDTLPFLIIIYIALLSFQVWDNYYTTYICSRLELWMDRDLRNKSFCHLQTLSFTYFNKHSVGYIHARIMSDTGKIGELVSWRFMDIIWNLSYIVCIVIVMLFVNVKLALVIIVLIPVSVIIILLFQKKLLPLNKAVREINSKISGHLNEGITGIHTIKSLVAEDRMNCDFKAETLNMKRASVKTAHHSALFTATMTFMSYAALSLILWQGGQLTLDNIILIGTLSVFMSYALDILEPIQNLIKSVSILISIQANIERLRELLNTESDVKDSKEVRERYGDAFLPRKENWEELKGDIEFKDVSFIYPDGDEYVLKDFNLKVPFGTNVAIVGETGAGKSTLVNLVCRFYEPTKGQLLIDGRDARERSQGWLHANLGYVLQTPHLFTGTVRENLIYGKPDASDEEIFTALKAVSADELVKGLRDGLDTDVGEGGNVFSTGERQLISFARAILCDPRILILDEATSSVDSVTEERIQRAIKTLIKNRTSFVIAHRLSTITDADVILAVRDGRIVEQGNHRELMAKRGYYFDLYTSQCVKYRDE
ncbi:MAG: ABC transporter ATP-binding protein/permease [Lachnospiraceae bacterium]|nr:ABC transporter ATP-binding protein/permease [Lachnospiraceae bacterium]